MLSYLQKYKELPAEMRRKASSPEVMKALKQMEEQYSLSLASIVMRIMVKELSIVDLPRYFVFEHGMSGKDAQRLTEELKDQVFRRMSGYLQVPDEQAEEVDEENEQAGQTSEAESSPAQGRAASSSVYSSNFFFSPEDEEEIKELSQKVDSGHKDEKAKQKDVIEGRIERIISESGIELGSRELDNRLRQILNTYIRGVRNKINVKEAMAKSAASGGLELGVETIDNIIEAADRVKNAKENTGNEGNAKSHEEGQASEGQAKLEKLRQGYGDRDFKYEFSRLNQEQKGKPGEKPGKTEDYSGVSGRGAPGPAQKKNDSEGESSDLGPVEAGRAQAGEEGTLQSKPREEDIRQENKGAHSDIPRSDEKSGLAGNAKVRQAAQAGGKKRMDDVKYKPKLTGPIDELREISLTDFRRMGNDPTEAAKKIIEKIEYLEGESYSKKIAGIKAWRQSPVNKMYLEIGRQSVTEHKKIEDIVENRNQEEQDSLSNAEFMAIMELNKNLRY